MAISDVVGRDDELARIARCLGGGGLGPRSLLIEGEAGIGKSTLWKAALSLPESARYRIVSSRAVEAETTLPFTTVGDLVEPVLDDASITLPDPQRRALQIALLRLVPEEPLEQRAVALASLGVLRIAAADRPLVIAIDDLQWVDPSSARILAFALRRLADDPVLFVASIRTGLLGKEVRDTLAALEDGVCEHLPVGPLEPDSIGRLIRQQLALEVPHPTILRITESSAGNPLHALEIARGLVELGTHPDAWEALPVPRDLRALLSTRVRALAAGGREVVRAASLMSRPRTRLVSVIVGDLAPDGLRQAEAAGLIDLDGDRIRFSHPLLASAANESMSEQERRALHARLAAVVEDPEESVRHRALAAEAPDAGTAAALDEAARRAWLRGASDAASYLVALARRLTPADDPDDRWRRGMVAALYLFTSGDVPSATRMLVELVETSPPGPMRARPLRGLALAAYAGPQVAAFLRQALEEAGDDDRFAAMTRSDLAWAAIFAGDLVVAAEHASAAIALAEHPRHPGRAERWGFTGDPELDTAWAAAESVRGALEASAMVEALAGRPARDLMARAVGMEIPGERFANILYGSSAPYSALLLMWEGEIARAREELEGVHRLARDRGWETVRWEQVAYLSELESRAGDWSLAHSYALAAEEIVREAGLDAARCHVLFPRALVEALQGETDLARDDATEGTEIAERLDERYSAIQNRMVLGFVELSCGDHAAAASAMEVLPVWTDRMGVGEPGAFPYVPDLVEALVALGDSERVEPLIDTLEAQGRSLDRPLALATAARCRGLVAASQGERDQALGSLADAIGHHARVAQPFELARTLLVLGEVQRRSKKRGDARASLQGALAIFDQLGAALWSARARAELARAGVSGGAPGGLTPTELRVAELAGHGKTNRQIAGELFISVKTVEANLSRVFHKLEVNSRREIASKLAASDHR